jgi:hypothetical protein
MEINVSFERMIKALADILDTNFGSPKIPFRKPLHPN